MIRLFGYASPYHKMHYPLAGGMYVRSAHQTWLGRFIASLPSRIYLLPMVLFTRFRLWIYGPQPYLSHQILDTLDHIMITLDADNPGEKEYHRELAKTVREILDANS